MNLIHSCVKQLVGRSVNRLRTRFIHWTKPLTFSSPPWNPHRSCQKQIGAHSGKCALTATTYRSQAAVETANMHKDGSSPPRAREHGRFRHGSKRTSLVQPETRLAVASRALLPVLKAQFKGLKLGIRVGKRTIQKYMRTVRTPQPRGQRWATFLRNHAAQIWACDALTGDRSLLSTARRSSSSSNCASRKVIHAGVARSPTDTWVAQHLREATPYGQAPKYLMCDNDSKFGPCFARVETTSGIEILKTPNHAPRADAICEHVAQECAARMPRPPVHPS